ncbi:MAG: type II secretion system GspH family protein [Firmicutes bacterium]|nr:type II secretion system GspH family protein [Bacillota bacterium]
MVKRKAFTLIETVVSISIICVLVVTSIKIMSVYGKTAFDRDRNIQELTENINILEEIRENAKTLPELYALTEGRNVKISAVGIGKIELHSDGTFDVTEPEGDIVSSSLLSAVPNLFCIEIGSNDNTKMITAVMIR